MSRADEIAQGLREPGGALTFPLQIEDYNQGHADFKAGTPPPRVSSASYDLGRARARQKVEDEAGVMDEIAAESKRRHEAVRELLKDRPDVLADYDARMAEIDRRNTHEKG